MTLEAKVFEKGGKRQDAQNQNAAASYIHLYQRQQLMIARKGENLSKEDLERLRHYSIIIAENEYSIWLT